ncbi:toluene tolerance protein [Stutzerimonas nitrititolerans]|uniref:toluene tolerance protein n=1 Tax=Stutzerimonas nitrititolerans TaxID=2482751 RepID=UPI00289F24AE|nr:toluene tolerance protein [Stutzerimonas nitrititolerans]
MRIVTAQELENWLASGTVLESDSRGPKVVCLEDGSFLKIFHSRKPLLSRWHPEAQRFARNAERLQTLSISVPQLLECCWLKQKKGINACRYIPLPGNSLDTLFKEQREQFDRELPALAAFIRQLHLQGVYFRSLHLGNILKLPNGGFGLVDFLDLHFKRPPLRQGLVRRNFAHLQNALTRRQVKDFPWDRLLQYYERNSS